MDACKYQRFGLLFKLSDADRLKLCKEIAEACEKSFRRGFQHGYMGCGDVVVDVERWRFATPLSSSPSPHGTYSNTALARHAFEAGLPCHFQKPERSRSS